MKKQGLIFVTATCFAIQCALALPVDLTAPTAMFGSANRDGTLLVSKELREADFGGGLRLPVRWIFQTSQVSASPYGWKGFLCPVLQASAVKSRSDLCEVTLLCGKKMYFTRQSLGSGGSGVIVGQTWKSADGEWTGEDQADNKFVIQRWDGWELEFKDGLISRLETDDGRVLKWEYESSATDQVKRVYEVATNNTVIEVATSTVSGYGIPPRWVSSFKINGDEYTFTYENDTLHEINFPDGRKISWTFADVEDSANEARLTLVNEWGYTRNWTFDKVIRLLRTDDVWAYAFAGSYISTEQRVSTRFGGGGGLGGGSFSFGSSAPAYTGGGAGTLPATVYDRPSMQRIRMATGEKEQIEYSASNSIETVTDILGNITNTYTYKAVNYMTASSGGSGGGSGISVGSGTTAVNRMYDKPYKIERKAAGAMEFTTIWRGSYDATTGDLIHSYDANDNETSYEYERFPGANEFEPIKKVTTTDPLGRVSVVERDSNGDIIKVTNTAGVIRKFVWDSRHRLTRVRNNADTDLLRMVYGDKDQVLEIYDAYNNKNQYEYTIHLGEPIRTKTTTPEGRVTEWTLDSKGRVSSVESPSGATWSYSYLDDTAALETVTDPASHEVEYEYDTRLNVTKITDEMGDATEFQYDDLDLPKEVKDALTQVTKVERNAYGDEKKITDAKNHEYLMTWRGKGRRKELQWPDGAKQQVTYNGEGLVTTYQPRGTDAVITNTWNEAQELSGQSWSNGTNSGSVSWSRNPAGQIASSSAACGLVTVEQAMSYNDQGQLASQSQTVGSVTRTASATYDLNGRLKTMTYPAGFVVEYEYNGDGQVTAIKKDGSTIAGYSYDTAGRLSARTLSNGVVTTYGYDTMDRVNAITVVNGSTALWAERYGYDAAGSRVYTLSGTSGSGGDAYSLDAIGQLKGVKYGASGADGGYAAAGSPAKTETWTYDAVGNRSGETRDATSKSYTANDINQYTAIASDALSYSARGDLAGYEEMEYAYDAYGNEMRALNTSTSQMVQYGTDGLGWRAVKDVSGAKTVYYNWGLHQLEAYDVGAGTATSTIYGPGIDNVVAEVGSSGGVKFYHQDWLNNVVLLTSGAGGIDEVYSYDGWGRVSAKDGSGNPVAAGAMKSRWLYTGRQFDKETGQYYLRNRSYDPEIGRFLQNDPIDFAAGDSNLYAYVANNPINWVDPDGRQPGVYTSDAWGNPNLSHAYAYDPETGQGAGQHDSSGSNTGSGVPDTHGTDPFRPVDLPKGMDPKDFMKKLQDYINKHNNGWPWFPFLNDCHKQLQDGFKEQGVPFPGTPEPRLKFPPGKPPAPGNPAKQR